MKAGFTLLGSVHIIINIVKEWLSSDTSSGMNVLKKAKRKGAFNHWEPIYIATNSVICNQRGAWCKLYSKGAKGQGAYAPSFPYPQPPFKNMLLPLPKKFL